jgi:hypothetical protein
MAQKTCSERWAENSEFMLLGQSTVSEPEWYNSVLAELQARGCKWDELPTSRRDDQTRSLKVVADRTRGEGGVRDAELCGVPPNREDEDRRAETTWRLDVPEVFGDVARAAGGVVVAGAESMKKKSMNSNANWRSTAGLRAGAGAGEAVKDRKIGRKSLNILIIYEWPENATKRLS